MNTRRRASEDIRVLAFVTDERSESVLKRVPFKELGATPTIRIGNPTSVYEYLKKNDSPDLLIIDLSGSSLPITDVERISEVCEPNVNVIALGEKNDVGVFRQLMHLGVSDYLVKPLNTNLLIKRINEVLDADNYEGDRAGFSFSGHTISFVGATGGVGASTFALNCGLSLSDAFNKHICVLDTDLITAPIAHMMDTPPLKGFVNILLDPSRVDSVVMDKMIIESGKRFDIISSEEPILTDYGACAAGLKMLMGLMAKRYNYSVVDCSHNTPNEIKKVVFKYSNTIVIVCDLTFSSVRETALLVRYFKDNANLQQKIMVLANKSGLYQKGEISVSDYEDAIDHPLTFVSKFDKLDPLESLNNGEPVRYSKGSLSKDIDAFTSYLMGKPLDNRAKTFFNRFFHKASL